MTGLGLDSVKSNILDVISGHHFFLFVQGYTFFSVLRFIRFQLRTFSNIDSLIGFVLLFSLDEVALNKN